jgi:hypothetical protein
MANIPVSSWNWLTQTPQPLNNPSLLGASVIVGPSNSNEITVTATGIGVGIGTQTLLYVFLQARQQYPEANQDFGWNDEFALQVIDANIQPAGSSLTFRVKRLDSPVGWGQNLQVDILMALLPFVE